MRSIDRLAGLCAVSALMGGLGGCRDEPAPVEPVVVLSAPAARADAGPVAPAPRVGPTIDVAEGGVSVADVALTDQDGRRVNVARDLGGDKLLVMNFIFTTCKGICPPMGLNFGQLQTRLAGRLGRDVNLVSVSVDPGTDTPERLRAWGLKYGAAPGWTLLTGPKPDVDRLLKGLGTFSPDKFEHTPFVLIGRASGGRWQRVHGLTPAETLARLVLDRLGPPSPDPTAEVSPAQTYFGDVPLIDQDGKSVRLYTDLLKGKVVVITPFFTSCRGSCSQLIDTFTKLQTYYGERVGKDLFLISITVDPETDRPEALKSYGARVHALPGWSFVTGDRKNLTTALARLGHTSDVKEDHTNLFIIGNEKTGLWKKAMGLAPPGEVIKVVDSVLNDNPP